MVRLISINSATKLTVMHRLEALTVGLVQFLTYLHPCTSSWCALIRTIGGGARYLKFAAGLEARLEVSMFCLKSMRKSCLLSYVA